jgi:hypothetical protein
MQKRWRTARLIHLPVHASWLNQIELNFSIVSAKRSPPKTSPLSRPRPPALTFGEPYRQIARPFECTFTRQELNNLIARIDQYQPRLALAA